MFINIKCMLLESKQNLKCYIPKNLLHISKETRQMCINHARWLLWSEKRWSEYACTMVHVHLKPGVSSSRHVCFRTELYKLCDIYDIDVCSGRTGYDTNINNSKATDMDVSYIWTTHFCSHLLKSLTKKNSTVAGQSDITESNATELCSLPLSYLT
jgi:hypothetical protein